MARPMPVLPDVPSMMVPPGFSRPSRSASSIILTAMRSLMELPGLKVSSLTSTCTGTSCAMRLDRGARGEGLELDQYVPGHVVGDPVDPDHRRVADGVEDRVGNFCHGVIG